jgi:hypothetical protein
MTIIRAACPTCGDVELTKDQVRLVVHAVRNRSYYAFDCTSCVSQVRKPAGEEVVRLLTLGGVVAERVEVPAEALETHDGATLTCDDLLDFVSWLDGAHGIVDAAASGLHARLLAADPSRTRPTRP